MAPNPSIKWDVLKRAPYVKRWASPMSSMHSIRKRRPHRTTSDVLCYSPKRVSQGTVRRAYEHWRREQGKPMRCDIESCVYYTQPLVWGGRPFKLILDHVNGVRLDNSPENLRFVCPNCESQLPTHGGRNRGRLLEAHESKYSHRSDSGHRNDHIIPKGAELQASGLAPNVVILFHENKYVA